MGVLLRLTKQTVWSGAPADAARRDEAVKTFQRREEDTDGLSVYEIENDAERELVIAAVACDRLNEKKPIDLLEVPRELVERYGAIEVTEGTTHVPAANKLHRSLDWDAATLEHLAESLFEAQATARRYRAADIRAAVRKLDVEAVVGEEVKAFVRDLKAKA